MSPRLTVQPCTRPECFEGEVPIYDEGNDGTFPDRWDRCQHCHGTGYDLTDIIEDHGPCDLCSRTLVIRQTSAILHGQLAVRWMCSECVGKLPGKFTYVRKPT